jgi:L,D-peptidoglycan transpeptidase YkuD (ErfK/YbiS/YcfS/YnhG family)
MHGGKVERSYPVALALNSVGSKERSGHPRTPEGTYRLEHSPRSVPFHFPHSSAALPAVSVRPRWPHATTG